MADFDCPYCGAPQEVCHDDGAGYTEGQRHEQTCHACDKTYVFETTIVLYYEPQKADCLHGSPHDLEITKTWPKKFARMRCKTCDYERQMTDAERDELLKEPQS